MRCVQIRDVRNEPRVLATVRMTPTGIEIDAINDQMWASLQRVRSEDGERMLTPEDGHDYLDGLIAWWNTTYGDCREL
jgi:hypothetical protein